jgi:hypothetical protein
MWAVARLEPRHERLGVDSLERAGFSPWYPQICEHRIVRGRRAAAIRPLFFGYCFVVIGLQWHAAVKSPGVHSLIMDGLKPARCPDSVIAELKARERAGLVQLDEKPRSPGRTIPSGSPAAF